MMMFIRIFDFENDFDKRIEGFYTFGIEILPSVEGHLVYSILVYLERTR